MRRFLLALALTAGLAWPAAAESLLSATITTAVTGSVGSTYLIRNAQPNNLYLQAVFTYGSGGTSATAYVQTSFDGGTTWIDIASFGFTTASATKVVNLSALNSVTTVYTPTDGSLSSNTVKDGLIGPRLRVKYTTVGTYGGSTTLVVTAFSSSRMSQ